MIIDTDQIPIPTWTEPHCLNFLAKAARHAMFAVELGTYFGASARVMLQANPKLHLWCVDKFEVFGSRQVTEIFLGQWISEGRCELIVGDSKKANEMLLPRMRSGIDLCFVDDGHEDFQVLSDIWQMLPLISPSGLLCGHDYDGDNDVARGVHKSGIKFDLPVPRMWRMIR